MFDQKLFLDICYTVKPRCLCQTLTTLSPATTVGIGIAALAISMVVRLTVSSLVTFGQGFDIKEKIFVSISWIPKGTVQVNQQSCPLPKSRV